MACFRSFYRAAQRYPVVWVGWVSAREGIGRMASDCMRRVVRHHGFHSASSRLSHLSLGGRIENVEVWFIATSEHMSMV